MSLIDYNALAQSYRRIVSAILLRGVKDAQKGDDVARAWLCSYEAQGFAEVLGLEHWPPNEESCRRLFETEHAPDVAELMARQPIGEKHEQP